MSTETRDPATPAPTPARRPWMPVAVFGTVVVAVLVIATMAGSLFGGGSLTVPAADSVDVGFSQDMSVHHRQAVEMASWARDNTRDPAVRQLAFDIESTQNQQIGRMQGWLGLWNMPTLPTGGYMAWMSGHGGMGGSMARMPGMATSDDLRRLRATPPPAMDVVFLQLMLRHHEGGTSMLVYGKENAENPEVRNLADQMLTAQSAESQLMTRMLAERGARPLSSTEKHANAIFDKLGLAHATGVSRRVVAVVRFLGGGG